MTCECFVDTTGLVCGSRARWLVGVGVRKTDAQFSCGIHLSRTCEMMLVAEDRPGAVLTVTRVRGE